MCVFVCVCFIYIFNYSFFLSFFPWCTQLGVQFELLSFSVQLRHDVGGG